MLKNTSRTDRTETRSRDRELLHLLFQVDGRSLAVVRIGAATLAVLDLVASFGVTDWGANWLAVGGSFMGVAAGLALTVGFRSRLSAAILWVAYGWPLRLAILPGGPGLDLGKYILGLALFWLIFLPSGTTWGLEARKESEGRTVHLSVGSAGLLAQIFIIYVSAGLTKNIDEWVISGTALEALLSGSIYASDLGRSVAANASLMRVSSWVTVGLEVLGSLALFLPIRRLPALRTVLVACFVAFHVGIALFMDIGIFPYVMMVIWIAYLPTEFWERLLPSKGSPRMAYGSGRVGTPLGAAALAYVVTSNVITLMYYPVQGGWMEGYQLVGRYLLLYQQWLMFSVPSSLVIG